MSHAPLHVAARPVRRHRGRGALRDAQDRAPRARVAFDFGGAGFCALPTSASGAPGSAAVRMAQARVRGSPPNGCDARAKKRLTIRSSSEWKLIATSRPPVARSGTRRGSVNVELQTTPGSRKSEAPGTSAWPDPDPNHPACARRWLRPRSSRAAACVRWVGRASRSNCSCNRLSKPFFTIVADHLRQFAHRRPREEFGGRFAARWDPSACRADRRRETRSRALGRRSAARKCRGRGARRRLARAAAPR